MAQPHIGTFVLRFGDIIQSAREEDRQTIENFEKIITQLKDIIKSQATDKSVRVKDIMIQLGKQKLEK